MLRDIAAVDFLTQLSPNVEPRLRAVIDGTLDQLCHLPDLLPSQETAYVHRSHGRAPTGVASSSQIFFSCFCWLLWMLKVWSFVPILPRSNIVIVGCDAFICNMSRWRRTFRGLFPQGWTEPRGGTTSEDCRYCCFKKALHTFSFLSARNSWCLLLVPCSARVCEMSEVFSVPVADADKHWQAYSLIEWEVRGRFVVIDQP